VDTRIIPQQTLLRSFARRIGKSLRPADKLALAEILPQHSCDNLPQKTASYDKIYLEIGFGMGEHFMNQVISNPSNLYIGAEVYLNGAAAVLKKLNAAGCSNYLIWANDVDALLTEIPAHFLDGIYILFPDPWPKRRYIKKRLVNAERIKILKAKLKADGNLIFASDILDYFLAVKRTLEADQDWNIKCTNGDEAYEGYVRTKYHSKAIQEGRDANFAIAKLLQP
jgi:release factor glutamine methyltransferase